jgi:hypothetical protein
VAAKAGATSHLAGFDQSLHLNLGECYRKLGELDRAREQFERGQAAVGSLGDDGYGQGNARVRSTVDAAVHTAAGATDSLFHRLGARVLPDR